MTDSATPFGSVEIRLEIALAATRETVYRALTSELGAWWPKTYLVNASAKGMTLEPRVGGRMFEDWGDGQGLLWATVVTCKRGELLQTAGELFPEFGGPSRVMTTFRLEAAGDGTLLRVHLAVLGRAGAKLEQELSSGWKQLLAEGLKPFVEREADSPGESPCLECD